VAAFRLLTASGRADPEGTGHRRGSSLVRSTSTAGIPWLPRSWADSSSPTSPSWRSGSGCTSASHSPSPVSPWRGYRTGQPRSTEKPFSSPRISRARGRCPRCEGATRIPASGAPGARQADGSQLPAAAVALRDGFEADGEALRDQLNRLLQPHERIDFLQILNWNAFPIGITGKTLKRVFREQTELTKPEEQNRPITLDITVFAPPPEHARTSGDADLAQAVPTSSRDGSCFVHGTEQ
jgi:hypothetical protein